MSESHLSSFCAWDSYGGLQKRPTNAHSLFPAFSLSTLPLSLSLSLSLCVCVCVCLSLSRRFPTRGSIASSRRSSGTSACSNRKNQMGGVKCGGQTWGSNAGVQMRGSNRGGQIGGVKTGGAAGRGACCSRRRGRSRAHASQCTFSFEVTRPDQILEIWQKWGFDI